MKRTPGPKEPRQVSIPAVRKAEAAGPKGNDSSPRRPIAAVEDRPLAATGNGSVFDYNENEPLRLISNSKTGE
jgi:hypothetical protein